MQRRRRKKRRQRRKPRRRTKTKKMTKTRKICSEMIRTKTTSISLLQRHLRKRFNLFLCNMQRLTTRLTLTLNRRRRRRRRRRRMMMRRVRKTNLSNQMLLENRSPSRPKLLFWQRQWLWVSPLCRHLGFLTDVHLRQVHNNRRKRRRRRTKTIGMKTKRRKKRRRSPPPKPLLLNHQLLQRQVSVYVTVDG